jgi:hypothetical protein
MGDVNLCFHRGTPTPPLPFGYHRIVRQQGQVIEAAVVIHRDIQTKAAMSSYKAIATDIDIS